MHTVLWWRFEWPLARSDIASRTIELMVMLWWRFEWPLARSDIASRTVELMVKNSTGIFSKGRVNMGQLHLDLSQFDDLTKASTEWFDMLAFLVEVSPFFAICVNFFLRFHNLFFSFFNLCILYFVISSVWCWRQNLRYAFWRPTLIITVLANPGYFNPPPSDYVLYSPQSDKITFSFNNLSLSWIRPSRYHKDVLCSCCKTGLMMLYFLLCHSQLVTETYWFMLGMILKTRTLWLANSAFSFVTVTTISQRIFLAVALQRTATSSSYCCRNCAWLWSRVFPRFFIITNYSTWQPGQLYLGMR